MPQDDAVDPSRLEHATFNVVRRGFDPAAVRGELRLAAEEIRGLRRERDELAGRLAEFDGVAEDRLVVHRVAEALGVEAANVLEAAHDAAVERADRAEREAEAVRTDAAAAAETLRMEASAESDEVANEARREAERLVEEGRVDGREMVAEAQLVRERMLRDLARKRHTGRAQVEQLRAGRDRLLESLSLAQRSLDEAITDLIDSVPEARAAAERAGLRIASEEAPTVERLEAEIEAARMVGHPLLDDLSSSAGSDRFDTGEMKALTHVDDALGDEPAGEDEQSEDEGPVLFDIDNDDGDLAETGPDVEGDDGATVVSDIDADVPHVELEVVDERTDEADVDPVPDDDDDILDEADADPAPDDAEPDPSGGVFAKLRESQASSDEDEPTSGGLNDDADRVDEADESDRLEGSHQEGMAAAETATARALKKVLVDEQGVLLDGIRRTGADAIRSLLAEPDRHSTPYSEAARPVLQDLAATLGASLSLDLEPANAQIRAVALDPVRHRLTEVVEQSDDEDELTDAVRALYRESRSRRIPESAVAAVAAVCGAASVAVAEGPLMWVVAGEEPCSPDCAENVEVGAVEAGQPYPSGDVHPPAHPGCSCRLLPAPG